MKNNYDYIDLDSIYTDTKTGILRNKENISDREVLLAFESLKVSEKLELLQENPSKIKNPILCLKSINFYSKMYMSGMEKSELLK
jgi:arsenate reductase-like glutaredoxin family protein